MAEYFDEIKGHRGNLNLKKTGVNIHWTPEMIKEYVKCSKDPSYFAEHFMKIVSKDEGLVIMKLYPYQKKMLKSMHKNRFSIFTTARQAGKALPLDTEIPTPNGWKTMKDLQPGDNVFDENGKSTKVTAISPVFINHDCYKITFDDGSTVTADAEHLWTLKKANNRNKKPFTITTQEMFDLQPVKLDNRGKVISKWKIETTKPVQYEKKEVSIDPYLLGVWLGDGEAASGRITCEQTDLQEYKMAVGEDFSHNHRNDHIYTGTVYTLAPRLKKYNLLSNKHIPTKYLFNSIEDRIALLQGLMDTDGWVEHNGQNCIALSYNRYPQLIDDVYELLCSLGLKVFRKKVEKTNSERLYFHCSREMFDVFRLQRKLDKQVSYSQVSGYTSSRFIRKIEKVNSVPTKCITVDSPNHLYLCTKSYIPTHNSTVVCAYILWYIIFNDYKTVGLLANKGETAREILTKVQIAYQNLPRWLQQGIVEWNKGSIVLENNSRVIAAATSSDAIRGYSINLLFIDEAAHIDNWDEFFTAVYPTISSGKTTQVVLVSTPYGLNHFHKTWSLALQKKNDYHPIKVMWYDVPGRDKKWKQDTLAGMNFDQEKFSQEHECEFLGSSGTLIAGWKLKELVSQIPIHMRDGLYQYKRPEPEHKYALVADVARGKGIDYSAFSVIDITEMPYDQVAVYRNNLILPVDYGEIIHQFAKLYNDALVLVETNDIGEQITDILYFDYEYINVVQTENAGAQGKRVSQGFSGKRTERGVRTTIKVKNTGCSILKMLIEQNQLIINDQNTIHELSRFSKKNKSYEAEPGSTDDITMSLVLFAWMSDQDYFKEWTDIMTLHKLREKTDEEIMNELLPFGLVCDGQEESHHVVEDNGDEYDLLPDF